ncbi:MAG: hypothetical protein LQ351_001821 [Letrouitia transgressa]|nr:MAG: hypothetical protein LQ351_001821 [Letrouitia transgressa]
MNLRSCSGVFRIRILIFATWLALPNWVLTAQKTSSEPSEWSATIAARAPLASDVIPSGDQWIYADEFLVPGCVFTEDNSTDGCPDFHNMVLGCTSEQCTETFFGACMQTANLTDERCVCEHYNSGTCKQTCLGDIHRHEYLSWLNSTCAHLSGWSGLEPGWESIPSPLETLKVGNISWDQTWDGNWNPTYTYTYKLPSCISRPWQAFNTCIADPTIAPYVVNDYTVDLWPYGLFDNNTLYLDQSCFCTHTFDDIQEVCTGCDSDLDRTELFAWYNVTCYNATVFQNIPNNWTDDVLLFTDNYLFQEKLTWLKCLRNSACSPSLNETEVSCTSTRCQLDATGNCTTALAVERSCFCKDLSFENSCNGSCSLSWERLEYLDWLNETCSPIPGWNGLPHNWLDLREIQIDELLPWHWSLRADHPSTNVTNGTLTSESQNKCPSTAAKLGAYAAINGVIAVLVPILGRRTFVHRITFGFCGHPWSRMWIFTGLISIGLQVGSNLINAHHVKSIPGFHDIPMGELTLLWCTRPRLAWLVVALLPVQAKKAMYFSVVASTLTAEVVLQLLGSVYMGRVTNYGRKQHFYLAGHLAKAPHSTSTQILYAGSLLWLTCIVFAITGISFSVLRVNEHIISLKKRLTGLTRLSKKRAKSIQFRLYNDSKRSQRTENFWAGWYQQFGRTCEALSGELARHFETLNLAEQSLEQHWRELQDEWRFMADHLGKDRESLKKPEYQRNRLELESLPAKGHDTINSSDPVKERPTVETTELLDDPYIGIPLAKRQKFKDPVEPSIIPANIWSGCSCNEIVASLHHQRWATDPLAYLRRQWPLLTNDDRDLLQDRQDLAACWDEIHKKRAAEKEPNEPKDVRRLKSIARTVVSGMIGCWVAQVEESFLSLVVI